MGFHNQYSHTRKHRHMILYKYLGASNMEPIEIVI